MKITMECSVATDTNIEHWHKGKKGNENVRERGRESIFAICDDTHFPSRDKESIDVYVFTAIFSWFARPICSSILSFGTQF